MDFLTPIFAAVGVAAATIPVVLHMLRRAPTQDMPFSIVRFLKPSQPKLTKRSNIEHWPLMLLRILALVLIGLAFARPFLREVIPLDAAEGEVQSVTILIDKSASMRREGIYDQVQETLRESIDELNDEDLLSVMTFSESPATLVSRDKWATATQDERAAMVQNVIDSYEPDWLSTNTGSAMRAAADELAAESKELLNVTSRRLVLITDFQRGSNLDELKSGEWPATVEVQLKTVEPTKKGNAGVTFVKDRRADRTRVRIASAGDSVQQEFQLQPFDASGAAVGESMKVTVAPGQRRTIILPALDPAASKSVAGVELKGDDHPFDNVIDLPELESPVVKVAHIGPATLNDPESMRYYLQRVLDGNVERDVKLIDLMKEDGVVLPVPADVKLVVATAVVPDGLLDSLSAFLDRSGTLLMAPPSIDAVLSVKTFLPSNFEVKEADVDEYAMLSQIDFDHPLFSTFSDARFADFSSIRFWQHRNLVFNEEERQKGEWTVVAKFDSGVPAIAELPHGDNGRVILLATGWHPADSQWALSTRFAPLLTRILSLASPAQKDQVIQTVGDVIRPGQLVSSDDWSISFPNGTETTAAAVSAAAAEGSTSSESTVVLNEPGRYTITGKADDGEYNVSLIAGLGAAESRTEMLPIGQLQVLGIGVEPASGEQLAMNAGDSDDAPPGQLSANELEKQQKWWRWLLLSGLGCLLLESLWASAIERRSTIEA
ncbi:BatA domain-containing protein [Fuerstiella marisgermanici]|uniref:VWFA domain-containing protein n=1 Tax=Fuerstiella marisgermanici TaxID=1891926 RepID=A0A1P8WP00_9PLAN|nr:BatA domain-containing protein [Fuerstiella marisgermanici]APZ95779.1 hypothetical protein Fuma_05441 [Fuerstiella marisgermanici]